MFATDLRLSGRLRVGCLCGVLGLWAATAWAADPWNGARIMPKSDQVLLRDGRECTGGTYQIEWPATVERIEGQWLWVVDCGGYHVPPVSGWISKADVLKFSESHDYYMRTLKTCDAPWLHWLMGIYLENAKESSAAKEEYRECLQVGPDASDGEVLSAVQRAPQLLDAAVRLARLKAEAKSVDEAAAAAGLLLNLSETAQQAGMRRPQLTFDQADILRKVYHLKVAEERKQIRGIDGQIARAKAESKGGTTADQDLFRGADYFYQLAVSPDCNCAHADPNWWKPYLGRAELYLDRVTTLEDEVRSLVTGTDVAQAPSVTARRSPSHLEAAQTPIDLKMLDDLLKRLESPAPGLAATERANAAGVALVAAIQSLRVALGCFDEAIRRNPELIEAYRDRGLAYLVLAQSEGALAALEDSDPKLEPWLADFYAEPALPPGSLDRAIAYARADFHSAVKKLRAAQAAGARVASEKKGVSAVEDGIAKAYVSLAIKHGSGEGSQNKTEPPRSETALRAARDELARLGAEAVAVSKAIADKEEKAADDDLRDATATISGSCQTLHSSQNLQRAARSVYTACEKSDFASAESLNVLAAVYAAQCNFDRAEFYQKLAVIFASEEERPTMLDTLGNYRAMLDLVAAKKAPKTPPSRGGKTGHALPDDDQED